ncbi:hypothetical protein VNO77_08457 [Canavalia gladiata]|uniref:Uncharacterized protein n=1 Tax=Canavalia gladiata TaxID=3824 RepID=A0AAN9MA32_CANGL
MPLGLRGEGLSSILSPLDSSLLVSLKLPCKETMTHSLWSIRRNSSILALVNKYEGQILKASCTCCTGTMLCDVGPHHHAYEPTSSYVSRVYASKLRCSLFDLHDHSLGFFPRVTREDSWLIRNFAYESNLMKMLNGAASSKGVSIQTHAIPWRGSFELVNLGGPSCGVTMTKEMTRRLIRPRGRGEGDESNLLWSRGRDRRSLWGNEKSEGLALMEGGWKHSNKEAWQRNDPRPRHRRSFLEQPKQLPDAGFNGRIAKIAHVETVTEAIGDHGCWPLRRRWPGEFGLTGRFVAMARRGSVPIHLSSAMKKRRDGCPELRHPQARQSSEGRPSRVTKLVGRKSEGEGEQNSAHNEGALDASRRKSPYA